MENKLTQNQMDHKRHYVVRAFTGFLVTRSKKAALKILKENMEAFDVIISQSKTQNYYHNRVRVIAEK